MYADYQIIDAQEPARRLLKNIRDYSRAVVTLTFQRQSIFVAIALLTGWFFVPWKAALFFSVCMLCEYFDLKLASKVEKIEDSDQRATNLAFAGFIGNTILSALAICTYAVWVGITEDGSGKFTALFCLFAAALYAAMRNHHIANALAIRLTLYGVSFLAITAHDLWVYRPPLSSEMWLQFFTIVFVMYFLIDCSLGFLNMYRQDLKRLEDLQIEHDRAKAALVHKSEFVSVVSHELRTPLTSIKGSLELINTGKFGEMSSEANSLLQLAGRNSSRLASLVDDLLDIQKIDAGKLCLKKQRVEVSTLLADALESHQGLAQQYSVTLNLKDESTSASYIEVDPARLMQVLGNVISNAAKFSPEQGSVDVWFSSELGKIKIFVRDYGVGIPAGSRDKVFGRFTQIDSSKQRQFGGTGLGMSIAREIVEASGGSIDYHSKLGAGTTFCIEIPEA